jgi:hypothetical protein
MNSTNRTNDSEITISLPTIRKWAKTRLKDLKGLEKALERAGDNLEGVLKERLDKTNWRALGNRIKKLKREFPTAARFRQKAKAEVAWELKRFEKIAGVVQDRD